LKNIKLLALFFLVFFNTIHTAVLDQMAIERKAVLIEKKMTQDRYFFYGLAATSIVYQVSLSFAQLKHACDTDSSETKTSSSSKAEEKLSIMQRLQALPQSFKESFKACKAGLRHLVLTKEGWTTTATATAQILVGVGSSIFISKLCEKFAHPDTLRWYIHTYAPHYLTIKMMKDHLSHLQGSSLDEKQVKMSNELLQLLYAQLVRQGLSICAYITYKTKHLDEEEKIIAERLKVLMLNSQNSWLERIGVQLAADNRDYQEITKLITAFEADIASQINHFSVVEGESMEDRIMIKKQIEACFGTSNKAN